MTHLIPVESVDNSDDELPTLPTGRRRLFQQTSGDSQIPQALLVQLLGCTARERTEGGHVWKLQETTYLDYKEPDESAPYLLHRLTEAEQRRKEREFRQTLKGQCLTLLEQCDTVTTKEAAKRLDVNRGTVGVYLKELVEEGRATRHREGRSYVYELAEAAA
ncbi:MAG: hypothetical protein M3220_15000 [Chloroflexota bacterium]|nr:hypothetical protein [Chloroflexota bacterium]